MASLLLVIIYLAFISLGLPDSVYGSVITIISADINTSLSYMGLSSIICTVGTIISSVFSVKLIKKIGTGWLTAVSVMLTAIGLLGFGLSQNFVMLCVMSLPYGLGAGAVDTALNNYVATHYSSRHMSWLHCCWGLGASVGPYVMGFSLKTGMGWRFGYGYLAIIQTILAIVIFATLFLWKKNKNDIKENLNSSYKQVFKISGLLFSLIAFFCYCAFECTAGLWASAYLIKQFNISKETASFYASLFYLGITLGRFLSGFFADILGDKKMIRLGCCIIIIGLILIVFPTSLSVFSLVGLIIIGFGASPIYPCLMHLTPINFGKENSQAIMGLQTTSAYLGFTLIPPLFGIIIDYFSAYTFGYYMFVFVVLMIICIEVLNKKSNTNILKNSLSK